MKIHNSIKINTLILASCFLLLSTNAQADDWTCTDVASIKNENSVMACGVATAETEGEAREKALRRARTEFELICETSAECVGKQTIVEPLRNSCETLANGRYKCFRGLRYTILDSGKPAQRPTKTIQTKPKQEPAPTPVQSSRVEQSAFEYDESKKFAIGIAAYTLSIAFSDSIEDDANDSIDFSGGAFFLQFAPIKYIAIKLNAYSLTHDEIDDLTASGTDIQLLIGSNFTQPGGNFYLGIGQFDETWEWDNSAIPSADFSGTMYTLGLGYNWSHFMTDFHISVRDETEYVVEGVDATAISGALAIGFRF